MLNRPMSTALWHEAALENLALAPQNVSTSLSVDRRSGSQFTMSNPLIRVVNARDEISVT